MRASCKCGGTLTRAGEALVSRRRCAVFRCDQCRTEHHQKLRESEIDRLRRKVAELQEQVATQ